MSLGKQAKLHDAKEKQEADPRVSAPKLLRRTALRVTPLITLLFLWSIPWSRPSRAHRRARTAPSLRRTVRHSRRSGSLLLTPLRSHPTPSLPTSALTPVLATTPSVLSLRKFEAFPCHDFGPDGRFLIADVAVECGTHEHGSVVAFAWFAVVVYPVGMLGGRKPDEEGEQEEVSKAKRRRENQKLNKERKEMDEAVKATAAGAVTAPATLRPRLPGSPSPSSTPQSGKGSATTTGHSSRVIAAGSA